MGVVVDQAYSTIVFCMLLYWIKQIEKIVKISLTANSISAPQLRRFAFFPVEISAVILAEFGQNWVVESVEGVIY